MKKEINSDIGEGGSLKVALVHPLDLWLYI